MRYYVVKGVHGLTCYSVPLDHCLLFDEAFKGLIIAKGLTLFDAITGAGFNMQGPTYTSN